jgi:hypothetical protein
MTAFAVANIPSNVNTLEELLAWCASAIAEVNPSVTIQTSQASAEPICTCQTFRFASQTTNPERLVVVAYLPLTQNWRSQGKIWSNEISATALPAGYTSN